MPLGSGHLSPLGDRAASSSVKYFVASWRESRYSCSPVMILQKQGTVASEFRKFRLRLQLSQREFAQLLSLVHDMTLLPRHAPFLKGAKCHPSARNTL